MSKLNLIEGIVQDYTLVLSTRDYRHLGQISKFNAVNCNFNLNSANELSFTIYKTDLLEVYKDIVIPYEAYKKLINDLWDKIIDFRLVWVKELNEYYEIKVSLDDAAETIKTITGTSLCEAELSQTNIYSMEINTEEDISRKDYYVEFPTVFYRNPEDIESYNNIWNGENKESYCLYKLDNNGNTLLDDNGNKVIDEEATYIKRCNILKNSSLLHRALDKVPHYSIGHVDESLKKEQLTFSVSGSSIYDFLIGECAEQFNCLFKFDSATRTINVYDLYTVCNDCGYRGDDFYNKETGKEECPKCKGKNFKHFGKDTTIYIDKNNLTDAIKLDTNADNVKNCFRMASGDDLLDTAIMSLNPNGSRYIYYLSEYQRNDMPKELVDRIVDYNAKCKEKEDEFESLSLSIWEKQAEIDKLTHTLMPTVETAEVTSKTEVAKLVDAETGMKLVGMSKIDNNTSYNTVSNSVKNYAKTFVMSGYVKVQIIDEDGNKPVFTKDFEEDGKTLKVDENGFHSGTWEGDIRITNYSDREDVSTTGRIKVKVTDNYQDFMDQKILKSFAEEYSEEGSLFDVLATDDINKFKEYLKQYCQVRLKSFYDAIEGAIIILEEGNTGSFGSDAYNVLAPDYKEKLAAVQTALDEINNKINEIQKELDKLTKEKDVIQKELDFESYLGDLYPIFCAYRREGEYDNSNYVSTGLSDSELIDKAKEFLKVAKQELAKAGEPEYTLSSTLYNLLALDEFKPIVDSFELGNWIHIKVDGILYKLRLIGYGISFDNLQTLNVEFSNVSRKNDIIRDTQEILQSAQSMSSSYSYVAKQAEQGNEAKNVLNDTVSNGLNSSLVKIKNNDKEEVIWNKNGIICRSWNDEKESYDDEQLRITHNIMAFTDDAWKSCKTAIGKYSYRSYSPTANDWIDKEGYGILAEAITAGQVYGSTIVGGVIYSEEYSDGSNETPRYGSKIDLKTGEFDFAAGGLVYDKNGLRISKNGIEDALESIEITAENLHVNASKIVGEITSDQIQSIRPDKIVVTDDNKIKSEQIDSVNINQVNGIEDIEVKAENISGTIPSSKISDTLENKNVTGTFNGNITVSSVTTVCDSGTYNTITGEFTIGDITMKFVNGLLVNSTPVIT